MKVTLVLPGACTRTEPGSWKASILVSGAVVEPIRTESGSRGLLAFGSFELILKRAPGTPPFDVVEFDAVALELRPSSRSLASRDTPRFFDVEI